MADADPQSYRLSDETLVEVIMGKGKGNAREDYPDFWKTLGASWLGLGYFTLPTGSVLMV